MITRAYYNLAPVKILFSVLIYSSMKMSMQPVSLIIIIALVHLCNGHKNFVIGVLVEQCFIANVLMVLGSFLVLKISPNHVTPKSMKEMKLFDLLFSVALNPWPVG